MSNANVRLTFLKVLSHLGSYSITSSCLIFCFSAIIQSPHSSTCTRKWAVSTRQPVFTFSTWWAASHFVLGALDPRRNGLQFPPPVTRGRCAFQSPVLPSALWEAGRAGVSPWTPSCTQAEGTHEYTNTLDGDPQPFRDSWQSPAGRQGRKWFLTATPSAL